VEYPPHSLVYLEDIELNSAAFYCYTDRIGCCRAGDNPNGGAQGDWIFPNSITVGVRSTANDAMFFRTRAPRALFLNRNSLATGPTGIYTCRIPDNNGNTQSTYFGVYRRSECKYCNIRLKKLCVIRVSYRIFSIRGEVLLLEILQNTECCTNVNRY